MFTLTDLLRPFLILPLSAEQGTKVATYLGLLLKWNAKISLTALRDPEQIVQRHFGESFFAAERAGVAEASSLVDVGSGAGFPGLPMAIYAPATRVTLIESQQKKVAFLKSALAELRLPGVRAYAVRLEGNPSKEELPRVHAAVARAYAPPQEWLQLAQHYVLPGGVAICMLGPAEEAPERVGDLALKQQLGYTLPFSKSQRRLAIYRHL